MNTLTQVQPGLDAHVKGVKVRYRIRITYNKALIKGFLKLANF